MAADVNDAGPERRTEPTERLDCDLAIVGGGLAGTCCAITAARAGLSVTLVQDRPVLGGNASSEVRLWILGATSHMGNNNRWAREGGVVDEILCDNMYRNPEGNPVLVDTILLEKVIQEPNIRLLLNTAVYDLEKDGPETIRCIRAFCSQNSTNYIVTAPLFVDASGDGIVGFLAGAAFRMGSESRNELGEMLAPPQPGSAVLGHTIYFQSRDTGRSVKFIPPSFALKDITEIPRYKDFTVHQSGCWLWWIEWGGTLDTIHDTERIKWELWKIVYGVWDYIKNSGNFPDAENLSLDWVGMIPGKRESRRFEGDYILTQDDIIRQKTHEDAVSYGGWAIDLHPADGVYSSETGCTQWHSKGVYQIPYRCLYSRNITNLFLAGRIISASHVAFGSTRVMATCAHSAQAVGLAAALCQKYRVSPRELATGSRIADLQRHLLCSGQFIPGVTLSDPDDLARSATVTASSELRLHRLPGNAETLPLEDAWAMMLPVTPGRMPKVRVFLDAARTTILRSELRCSSKPDNHTPDVTLSNVEVPVAARQRQAVDLHFDVDIDRPRYVFVCLLANQHVSVHLSDCRLTGLLALTHKFDPAVAKSPRQEPPAGSGIESFEFWLPQRRPGGKNFALELDPPLDVFGAGNLCNGITRPTCRPNAWVADFDDRCPAVALSWPEARCIGRVELVFDTDYDYPMESVLLGHVERVSPFCVRNVVLVAPGNAAYGGTSGVGRHDPQSATMDQPEVVLAELVDNHRSRHTFQFASPVTTTRLEVRLEAPDRHVPAALFEVRCYES